MFASDSAKSVLVEEAMAQRGNTSGGAAATARAKMEMLFLCEMLTSLGYTPNHSSCKYLISASNKKGKKQARHEYTRSNGSASIVFRIPGHTFAISQKSGRVVNDARPGRTSGHPAHVSHDECGNTPNAQKIEDQIASLMPVTERLVVLPEARHAGCIA